MLHPAYVLRPDVAVRRLRARREAAVDVGLIFGQSMEVDATEQIGWSIARSGLYEPAVTEAMWRLAAGDELAIDVGANVGYFTALLSARAEQTVAVEAHPGVARLLRGNASRWRAVTVIEAAASDQAETVSLGVPADFGENRGQAGVNLAGAADIVRVDAVRLDDVIAGRRVGVLKLDVEGHELAALHGAARTLESRGIRDVLFEEHDDLPTETSRALVGHGFTLFSLQEQWLGVRLGPVDGPRPRWHAPTYLATLEPERAMRRMDGLRWHSFRPRR